MPTGYEEKSLRTVIENWLYNPDKDARVWALVELRLRFTKTFPRPDYLTEEKKDG